MIIKKCYIAGAMAFSRCFAPEQNSVVIAADAGYEQLKKIQVAPDIIIGDFDSASEIPQSGNTLVHKAEKDDTDMMLAVKKGLELGCNTFYLYGGFGGRFDHTYANVQALCYIAENGGRGYLIGENECVTAVKNGGIAFSSGASGNISVFAGGSKACGVYERGLKYTLGNAELVSSFPLGVSNAFTGQGAEIEVKNGTLIIIWSGGPEDVKSEE